MIHRPRLRCLAALVLAIAALAGSSSQASGQFVQQDAKLSGAAVLVSFGWSVALSRDGTTALIGAPL